jgi:hypothetical protein
MAREKVARAAVGKWKDASAEHHFSDLGVYRERL